MEGSTLERNCTAISGRRAYDTYDPYSYVPADSSFLDFACVCLDWFDT
jgi:hypothetical protein